MDRQRLASFVLPIIGVVAFGIGGAFWYKGRESMPSHVDLVSRPQQELHLAPPRTVITAPSGAVSSITLSPDGRMLTFTQSAYGVSYSYPASNNFGPGDDKNQAAGFESGNFVLSGGTAMLSRVSISPDLYPNSNFAGGLFAILVNPTITNGPLCEQYGRLDRTQHSLVSSQTIHNIVYSEIIINESSMTTVSNLLEFHTFQTNRCYELDVEIDQRPAAYGIALTRIPEIQLERALVRVFLPQVKFVRPQ